MANPSLRDLVPMLSELDSPARIEFRILFEALYTLQSLALLHFNGNSYKGKHKLHVYYRPE